MKVKYLQCFIVPVNDNEFNVTLTVIIGKDLVDLRSVLSSGQLGLCSSIKKLCTIILITNGYESDKIEFVTEPN